MPIEVRPARRSDVPALSGVLARAFQDDPVFSWLQPDPATRAATLPGFFAAMARHHFFAGGGVEVAESAGRIGGATLWDPPGRTVGSSLREIAVVPSAIRAFRGRLNAARGVTDQMKAVHPEEPHWYLATIGSDTQVRGGGYGAALMHSRLERCDAEYAPAYLESSNPDNIGYYERFGFEVTGEIVIAGGGPSMYPMWRQPR